MANDVITPKYTVFDLGYEKCLAKSDSFYDDQGANADKVTDSLPSILIGGGGLIGNITMVDGFMQSSNYVAGSTGWKLTETTAYLPSLDLSGYLLATGGAYKTAATGSRVQIFPDANTGIIAYDDGGDTVFTVLVGGTDQGDVIIGSAAKYAKWDKSAATFTINGAAVTSSVITSVASGSDFSVLHWQETMVFSATDYDTVAWAAGAITLSDGTTYNIDAGNTGNMAARTFIYFDKAVSSTVLQITTTAATANGANKILIAVAQNNADNTSKATFQAFGGAGGQMVTVDMIAANAASVNEFISNTAQIKDAIITNAKIASLDVGKLTAGTVVSKAITLSFTEGAGDCYIAAGKTDFDHDESGFIMGIDDSDSNKVKLIIGTPTEYLMVDGSTFVNTLRVGGYTAFVGGATILSTTTERQTTSTSYVKLKELTIGRRGDYKLLYELITYIGNGKKIYWSLRKNGSEFSSGWSITDYSQTLTISSLVAGDIISLYGKVETGADGPMSARYFNLKVDVNDEITSPVYTSGYN